MLEDTNSLDAAHIPALVLSITKNVLSEDMKMNESLFYGEKCLFYVVAYMNMINDVGNLT